MSELFLLLPTVFALVTPIVGIRAVFKGEYKPQRITKFIFLFITSLFVATLFAQGERNGIILAIVQWLGSMIFFVLSIKYGMGGNTKSDYFVLVMALFAILIWKTTGNPTLALYMSILADFVGFLPTLIKAFSLPYTEDPKYYASDVIAGFFSLISLKSVLLQDLAFPLYIFLVNFLCMGLVLIGRRVKKLYELSN